MKNKKKLAFVKPGASEAIFSEDKAPLLDDGRGNIVTWNADHKLSIESQRQRLPIFQRRIHLLYLLETFNVVIVVGETGSGKSTQIPQYLYEAGWTQIEHGDDTSKSGYGGGCIAVTQPRRVSAVTLAMRVAEEKNWQLGRECGYAVRFENCQSDTETCIKFLTDGMLIREMMRDPLLKRYKVIMIDEAHERSLQSDLLLGLLKKIQRRRPTLRLIISSATIDADTFRRYFEADVVSSTSTMPKSSPSASCSVAILAVEGRQFPVEVHYLQDPAPCYLAASRDTALRLHKQEPSGDILIFLTGQEEVIQLVNDLNEAAQKIEAVDKGHTMKLKALPMYGALPHNQQLKVFESLPKNIRKIVVATNIAETSVTIPGIAYVIDCGFTKLRAVNPDSGLERLLVTPTSLASAQQRAGRAGRLRAGRVYRLYTEDCGQTRLPAQTPPEMQRCELSGVLLQLKALGVDNFVRFDFPASPPARHVACAAELLFALGALDSRARLTAPLGLRMAELPVHPMTAKMLLSASTEEGCAIEAASLAALLQVQHVFLTPSSQRRLARAEQRKFCVTEGDHLSQLNALLAFERRGASRGWCQQNFLHYRGLCRALQLRDRLLQALGRLRVPINSARGDMNALRRALVRGYFAQAARLHGSGEYYVPVRGGQEHARQLHLHPGSVLFAEQPWPAWVIFTDVTESDKEYMEAVTVIEAEWLYQLAPHYYQFGSDREVLEKRLKLGGLATD